jgi:hypothetical protein
MSYTATKWENRDKVKGIVGTKLNADNMNKIEEGIVAIDDALSKLAGQITPEQLSLLANVSTSLTTLQGHLDTLEADFKAHVHSNVVGDTTGEVIA